MGKGDKRTKRGKIINGSSGRRRPDKKKKKSGSAQPGVSAWRGRQSPHDRPRTQSE